MIWTGLHTFSLTSIHMIYRRKPPDRRFPLLHFIVKAKQRCPQGSAILLMCILLFDLKRVDASGCHHIDRDNR